MLLLPSDARIKVIFENMVGFCLRFRQANWSVGTG
jgi:hypothetical protein